MTWRDLRDNTTAVRTKLLHSQHYALTLSTRSLTSVCPLTVLEAKYEIPDSPVVNVTHAEVRLRSVLISSACSFSSTVKV